MENDINRKGDKVQIAGAYQYNAVHAGNTFQKNWHVLKLQTAARLAGCDENSIVLDIGSGSGTLVEFLPNELQSYTGLDANLEAILFSTSQYGSDRIAFKYSQIDELTSIPAKTYSHIFFLETIEHITPQQAKDTLENIYRVLQPNGICVITTPNRKSLWPFIEWSLDMLKLTPTLKGEQHEKLYSINELITLSKTAGLAIKEVRTMNGIAPWISFLGKTATKYIHRVELKNTWIPGSLVAMALQKPV